MRNAATHGMSKNGILRMWPRPPMPGISSIIAIAGEEMHDLLSGKIDVSCKTHSNNGPQKRLRHSAVVAE